MKIIILAAGYGTRLQRDITNDTSGKFSHLAGLPKPLVTIGRMPLISHWMKALIRLDIAEQVFLVTNELHKKQFEHWAKEWPQICLVSDGTLCNEERIGAVACIQLAVKEGKIDDDVLVIGGDTLFYDDFSLAHFLDVFKKRKEQTTASLVVSNQIPDEEMTKRGILEVNDEMCVTAFLEKPKPDETKSRRACPCFYLFSQQSLPLLDTFLQDKDRPIKERDATGNFIKYLYSRLPVYVFDLSGRFDVGSLAEYEVCHKHFLYKDNSKNDEDR